MTDGMTPERLAKIRANLPDPSADLSMRERNAHELLAEVDRLRAGIERIEPTLSLLHHRGLVDSPNNRDDVREALDQCRALLNPTEGETK